MGESFVVNINSIETEFVNLVDANDFIKQHLNQWSSFEDTNQPQIIVVFKKPNDTPTIGISTGETVEIEDIFGRR